MAKFRDLSKLKNSLSDRAAGDRLRHRQALKEAIRENLADIIGELDIFKIDPLSGKTYKVSVQLVEEYRFIYDENQGDKARGIGQKKDAKKGDDLGKVQSDGAKKTGIGQVGGNQPGKMVLELTSEDLDFVLEEVSKDLNLPFMDQRKLQKIKVKKQSRWRGIKESGIEPRLDIEASFTEKIKRQNMLKNLAEQLTKDDSRKSAEIMGEVLEAPFPFIGDDLRYHGLGFKFEKQANALIILIIDVSGSMDKQKRYFVKAFLHALYSLLQIKYSEVEIIGIAHDVEAQEISMAAIFHFSGDGGTIISSGPLEALKIIKFRYPLNSWNIYAVHCSDGDNSPNDDDKTVTAFKELVEICNLTGFIEVKPGVSKLSRTARRLLDGIKSDRFRVLLIRKKSEVGLRFRQFLEPDPDLYRSIKHEWL